ncbi:non-ribosomal peptide synthetase [Actinokineospora inagensis]|uniref:non-ribosomal peptide synthetase n=1 Tax=Actinokineospora inagensis TaxID=103730 RepID=UPI000428989C|nr:non-ribosomal peptide synthetase [Actinokineospora inagensis]
MDLQELVDGYRAGVLSTAAVLVELERRARVPLSEGQRGLWAVHRMEPDTHAYNVPVCLACQHIDVDAVENAMKDTVARHPVLATKIEGDQLVPAGPIIVEQADIVGAADLEQHVRRPFDLVGGPLVRLSVLTVAGGERYLLLVVHHIVIDGMSLRLVLETFLRAYQARVQGDQPAWEPIPASYREFVAWEREYLAGDRAGLDGEFWQRELADRVPLSGLPTVAPDAPHENELHSRRLTRAQANAVADFAAAHDISPGVFFLAVFTTLLHRYTGQEDIIVGMPTAGRPVERLDSVVGYFVNTLPVRSRPTGTDEFNAFAERVRATVFGAIEHGAYPFPRIVRDLGERGADLRSPVYQVVYNYQNFSLTELLTGLAAELGDTWPFRPVELHQLGEFDLTLDVVPGDGFALDWKYHPAAFAADYVERMAEHFLTLVDAIIRTEGRATLGELDLLGDAERGLVLHEWNRTAVDYPADRTCWDLFAERAAAAPDRPAVSCGDETLTYRELAERSTALAESVRGGTVGVCLRRSTDLVVALLAVVKSGAAYLPLDPDLPAERLSYLVEDSGADVVLCHPATAGKLSTLDTMARLHPIDRPAPAGPRPRPGGIAYVIYTSGSTGRPKGVVVPHRALTNFLLAMASTLEFTADDRLLAVTTHGFDIAALELFLPLITGGHCRIATATADPTLLAEEIADWRPTVLQATPATWSMLLRVGWRNETGVRVLCGGEALPEALKDELVAHGEVWNLYGPTETTIWSSVKRLRAEEPVTIGGPIANTRLYVLDRDLQPTPIGIPGELCISGDGVALGYRGQPALTADRFMADPFAPGRRLYRTGDVARRLPNGEIVVLGRMDNQVKLRGYRVELGEIEAVLGTHPDIDQGVVMVRSERLAAYFTGRPVEAKALREHLAASLPAYMVPSAFVWLESFPLNANGKIDRSRLTAPAERKPEPVHHVERTVRRVFADALGHQDIDRDTGFFDLGGDSFTAIDVVANLNREFGRALRPTALFAHPSVAAMARHLEPDHAPAPAPRLEQPAHLEPDAIAVVGMSCRFPGARDHREFWQNLRDGKTGGSTWSPDELRSLGVPEDLISHPDYVPSRSVVEDKAEFDAAFFGISPRDAELMDPQGRLLLMHAWKALEDAGYRPEDVPNTSVFTSTSTNFYQALLPSLMANATGARVLASTEGYAAWLLAQGGSVPTMISSKLGLKGPSMAVSTNCSSALTGVYLACQGLLAGEADQALVGAASLFSTMELGYLHQPGLNFASDGRSKAFAESADGMAGGEGVGAVVLKRARDAIADGDHVYCLIRGIAVNNDGGDKAGFYAPSVNGQVDVIRKALDKSGVDPATIRYVEAHGTGTRLGDPIEVAALTEAYRHYTDRTGYVGIGSVKSNIGHLDAAAGIAGLIKLALGLRHGEIPPTLHCAVPNPQIDWAASPFFVADRTVPVVSDSGPARAGLSSFGIGGTNVHAVLEQVPQPTHPESSGSQLVVLSARDSARLVVLARGLLAFLPEYRGNLAELAYTLQTGRRAMASRVAFTSSDVDSLSGQLTAYVDQGAADFEGSARRDGDELVALFARVGELRELSADWLSRGDWDKIARLWVSGVDVDWGLRYAETRPARVSLPTYPFDTLRFWPEQAPIEPVPTEPSLDQYRQITTDMDGLLRQLLHTQLATAGVLREPRPELSETHAKWLDHSMTLLFDGGEPTGAPDAEQTWRAWHEWKAAHPAVAAKADLAERMVEAIPAILAGRVTATDVMFPGGSFDLVEAVYKRDPAVARFNTVTAEVVRAEVVRRAGPVRILEIGAGTGSASERVFEHLAGLEVAEYCYTDLSKAFLIAAERRFTAPYLVYRTFDVERPPGAQGLATGRYDIVIANNVLHATEDIEQTVAHARELLRPGGVMVINELAGNGLWPHLAFGLLEGWWRHVDRWRLAGGPALSAESWRAVLGAGGRGTVRFPADRLPGLGQQVVVAQADVPAAAAVPPDRHVESALTRALTATLKVGQDELSADLPFADYGLDSLTGVALVRAVNADLGTDLDPSALFDNPSLRRLTRYILDEYPITAPAPVEPARPDEPRRPVTASAGREPIAIVGMSGRFPGARDVDEFWRLLRDGRDAVTPVTRWDLSGVPTTCADGGFMAGIDEFDPLFFGISGAEAAYMEPQQRLFLQEAWKALEDAGHAGGSLNRERCGIYVGCAAGDYFDLSAPSEYPAQAFWGNMNSLVPSRLAYYLDLHGPAMAVDTACSSSLVSVYLACQGLWTGDADVALAGGVYVHTSPRLYVAGARAGMLAPSGRCRSFDEGGDGFVPAEGVGVLVLKRLSDAEADGDHVHGVITGIGVNQDGTTNGITAPNGTSQERLIRQVYQDFAIDPAGIGLVEAHGTGTRLGDPVEFRALARAFRGFTDQEGFCSLGSSKANIGHAQSAAGVIGIIKAALAIKHRTLPGLLHHRRTNPGITLDGSPFYVHTGSQDWESAGPRRAAVTSLGASGTNAHAVIEEAPVQARLNTAPAPRLIALSARTDVALRQQISDLACHLRDHRDLDLGNVSYTLLMGRTHFKHRWVCVATDMADAERKLAHAAEAPTGSTRPDVLGAEFLNGQIPEFAELFRDGRYRRVPLPSYPFERVRYALPGGDSEITLTGDEFYLRQHRVRGAEIAPGAMYLQWVYAAARQGEGAVHLQDVVFLRPLGGPCSVKVELDADRFEVRTDSVVHSQGKVSHVDQAPRVVDIPGLLRGFRRASISPEQFYAEYRERGIDYGPAFRGVVAVHEAEGEVLAELALPDAVPNDFALPPSLVDSAMQCMRLLAEGSDIRVVFAIKRVEVLAPCTARMWAWLRRDGERIDIDLIDEHGTVCLALRGIQGRRARTEAPARTLRPIWEPVTVPEVDRWPGESDSIGIIASGQALDTLVGMYPSARVITDVEPGLDHLIWVAPKPGDDPVDGQSGVLRLFRTVKSLLSAGYGNRRLGWTVITRLAHPLHESERIDPTHAGVAGLMGTVAKEYPNWSIRVADVDGTDLSTALSLPADQDGNTLLHRDGSWFRQRLLPVDAETLDSRFRDGGVYVIVGGAGGLGTVISEHLIREHHAQVVWLGRRPQDARIDAAIAGAGSPAPVYLQVDATSVDELRQARAVVERRFGRVHGIVHSGLVLASATLAKMTEAEFESVLRGKVDVGVRLLEVFGDTVEVALFLSSINSYLKAIKHANYAAACTFLDSFALSARDRYGCPAKVLNLGYCFNNAVDGPEAVVAPDAPLIQPDELVAAIEHLVAGTANQVTLMKVGQALTTRGMSIGSPSTPNPVRPDEHDPRDAFADLDRLRTRTKELTALAI